MTLGGDPFTSAFFSGLQLVEHELLDDALQVRGTWIAGQYEAAAQEIEAALGAS